MHTILKTAITSILLLLISSTIFAQSAGDYRSNAAIMNWNTAADWETFSGGSWGVAGVAPTNANGAIEIRSGHTVTITATVTVDQVTVNGTLSLNSGITINFPSNVLSKLVVGSAGVLNVSGTINQAGIGGNNKIITVNGIENLLDNGSHTGSSSTKNFFTNGSTFNYDCTTTTGTIPTADWATGSTCVIRGITTGGAPVGLNQTFYNFTWDLSSLNLGDYLYLDGEPSIINGNYRILNTNTSVTSSGLALLNATGTKTITVGGNFEVAGDTYLAMAIDPSDNYTLNIAGNFILNDANTAIDLAQDGVGTINLDGNLTLSSGSISNSVNSACQLNFTGTTNQTITHAGGIVGNTWNINIKIDAMVNIPNGNFLGGTGWGGVFEAEGNAIIKTGSVNTLGAVVASSTSAGAIRFSNQTYSTSSTIEYNGVAPQFMASGNPTNLNYTINNSSGVTLNNNWTLSSGRTLTFTTGKLSISNRTFTINGTVSGMSASNSITGGSTSVITIGGSGSTGTLFFDQTSDGTTNLIRNFTLNRPGGSTTIGNKLIIPEVLTVTSGTFNTGDFLTLRSTASLTAQVGSVSGTISGKANIERYIPSIGRHWSFLTAPVASGNSIATSWRNGMFITGTGTGSGPVGLANYNSNGFDWTSANSPSMYSYNENQAVGFNSRWVAVTSTSTALNRGVGYRVYVRGDRSNAGRLDGSVTTQNEVTITAVGNIPTGAINVPITCSNGCTADDGWNLVGNPYPATLDWNTLQSSNSTKVSATYYILNPSSNTYDSWNGSMGDATRYISSGQSFWVKSILSSTNLSFAESHKDITQAGGGKFKNGELSNHLKITLSGSGFSNNAYIHQNTTGAYGSDNYDAVKFGYGNNQIATFEPSIGARMGINNLPLFGAKLTDTIEVEANVPATAANYQLSFANVNTFSSNLKVYLQDKFLNTIQDLNTANTYSFATNGTAGSTGNRFRILITDQTTPLPVVFTALEAKLNSNNGTDLKWSTMSEKNNAKFIVERSVDMKSFVEVGLVKAVGNSNVRNNYTFTDLKPEVYTTNYYRIKQVDLDGKFTYSNIASITTDIKGNGNINTVETTTNAVKVYPIPTRDVLNISMVDGDDLTYSIVDVFGSEVKKGASEVIETASSINVSELSSGIYFIVVKSSNGTLTKTKFIVE